MDGLELPFGSLNEVLEDLASRFILNLPPVEMNQIERICFQVEQAHWFYEDFIRPNTRLELPSYSLKAFTNLFFSRCAFLRTGGGPLAGWTSEAAYDKFLRYKERVPVCGAIMLNTKANKCLLVKGFKSHASWSFPRGKINQDESERECAIREVFEETSFSIAPLLRSGQLSDLRGIDYFEITIREQRVRMYVVVGVPEDWPFAPRTRQEISRIGWFPLVDLPTYSKVRATTGPSNAKFYMVVPFVGLLKSWIHQGRHRAQPPESTLEATSPSDNLDEATRTLQKLFFGDQMPAGQVPRPVEDDVVKDNGSDIESDYAKGIDLATSYASSLGSSYRVPSTHHLSSGEHSPDLSPTHARRRNASPNQWATPIARHQDLVAPKPQPLGTVQKLLDIIQASTPAPSEVADGPASRPSGPSRHPQLPISDRAPASVVPSEEASRLLALLQAPTNPEARASPSEAERDQKRQALLRQLELLALQAPAVQSVLFPPPPGAALG